MVSLRSKAIVKPSNNKKVDVNNSKRKKKSKRQQKVIPKKALLVPKEKFIETLNAVDKEIEWGSGLLEKTCNLSIPNISVHVRPNYKNLLHKLLDEARLCLLQRDWTNLARILTMAKPSTRKEHCLYFQVLVRYAVICLSHNPDKNLLDMFMQGVAACSEESEKQLFLNSLTTD